jgi:hypothetical protein
MDAFLGVTVIQLSKPPSTSMGKWNSNRQREGKRKERGNENRA